MKCLGIRANDEDEGMTQSQAGAEGRGGKQGPGPPLKYSAPVYIYN